MLHRSGMEWAYRLGQEPRRLWRRYLIGNTLFLAHGARQLGAARRAGPDLATVITHPSRSGIESIPRVPIGAASVHCVEEAAVLALITEAATSRRRPPVAGRDPEHPARRAARGGRRAADAYDKADLVLADGWPVVRAVRLLSGYRLQRITGADLLPALCEQAAEKGLRVGIVGGLHGAADEAAARLQDQLSRAQGRADPGAGDRLRPPAQARRVRRAPGRRRRARPAVPRLRRPSPGDLRRHPSRGDGSAGHPLRRCRCRLRGRSPAARTACAAAGRDGVGLPGAATSPAG